MRRRSRSGNATVELVLVMPLFLLILAFGGIAGNYARLISHGSSAADDMLRFTAGLDIVGLSSTRESESSLTPEQINRQWTLQNPAGDVTSTVTDLTEESDGMSAWNPTNQTGHYTAEDHIGFDEEIQRMLQEGLIAYNDQLGNVSFVTRSTPATIWYQSHGSDMEFFGSVEIVEGRSIHRGIEIDMTAEPWIRNTIPGGDIFNATFSTSAFRRMRPVGGQAAWFHFDDAATFHSDLETFLINQGESTATLQTTPYWTLHQPFQSPN